MAPSLPRTLALFAATASLLAGIAFAPAARSRRGSG